MDLILATSDGREIGLIPYDADIECGGTDSFEIGIPKAAWDGSYNKGMLIYVPGTEYGGIIGEMETLTNPEYVYIRGRTWRGLLQKKIIQPAPGDDYYIISGEANSCIDTLLNTFYSDALMQADTSDSGLNIVSYQFNRYTTLIDGINAMLSPHGYKARIKYVQSNSGGFVEVSAEPVENYTAQIELSEDDEMIINTDQKLDGVNHLICLGGGELHDRLVIHIYTDEYGEITPGQVLYGRDEIAEVYDFGSSESAEELEQGGTEYLADLKSRITFDAQIISVRDELRIGDIVSGRDFTTGLYIEKPIAQKILKITGEIPTEEYLLEE